MAVWENYGGNQRVRPGAIERPRSLAHLQQLVKRAAKLGNRIKCVGSSHSFSGVLLCDQGELLIDVSGDNESFKHVALVDDELRTARGMGKQLVTVQTSVVVADLAAWLDERGLGLATFGAVDGQTMVGAMATGTHGSDLRFGPLSNMTQAFILVDGRGNVLLVQPSAAVLKSAEELTAEAETASDAEWLVAALKTATPIADDDVFNACLIGIGVVGVIYAVVLEVESQYWLHETKAVVDWSLLKSQWQLSDEFQQAKTVWQEAKRRLSGEQLKKARKSWRSAQENAVGQLVQRLALVLDAEQVRGHLPAGNAGQPFRTFMFLINPYATTADGDHKCQIAQTVPIEPGTAAHANTCPVNVDWFGETKQAILRSGKTARFRWGCFHGLYRLFNGFWRLLGLDQLLTTVLLWVFRAFPKSIPDILDKLIIDKADGRTGPSHRILTRAVPEVKGWGIEVAVDLDRLPDALDDVLAKSADLFERRRYVTGFISIRFVAMTDALLGVSHDAAKVMIEPTMLKDTPHGERTLPALQRLIMDRHAGVIHWGLDWDEATQRDTQQDFAQWHRFREILQQTLDTDGRFANDYTRRLGIYGHSDE